MATQPATTAQKKSPNLWDQFTNFVGGAVNGAVSTGQGIGQQIGGTLNNLLGRGSSQPKPPSNQAVLSSVASTLGGAPKVASPTQLATLKSGIQDNYVNPIEQRIPGFDWLYRTGDAINALTGHGNDASNNIDQQLADKTVTPGRAQFQRQRLLEQGAWATNPNSNNVQKALGTGLEGGSNFIPATKLVKGASVGAKIINNALQGALFGGAASAGDQLATNGAVNPMEVGKSAATTALIGGGLGAAANAKSIASKIATLPNEIRTNALKEATTSVDPQLVPTNALTSYEGAPDRARVDLYKQQIQSGQNVEPLIAMHDSQGNLGVADGKHRLQAFKELGVTNVPVKVAEPQNVQAALQTGSVTLPFGKKPEPAQTDLPIVGPDLGKPKPRFADVTAPEGGNVTTKLAASVKENVPSTEAYIKQLTKDQKTATKGSTPFIINAKNEFSTKGVDALSPIEKPVEKATGGRDGAVVLRNQLDRSLRSSTIAGQYAKDNGLHQIIKGVKDTKAFDQYVIAKHAIDLEANGVKTGRNAAMDAQLINDLAPKYEAPAKALGEYNNKLLDKTVSYGLISKDTADYLKNKYPNYVPFDRIFSDKELAAQKGSGSGPASLSAQTVVQKIKGSDRQIHSPLESVLAKTHDVIAQGERNLAAKEIIKTKDIPGNPLGIKPLRTASDVKARIDLYSQAKELKPVQEKLQRLLKTQDKWAGKLQGELDKLNQKGLETSLSSSRPKSEAPVLSGVRDVLKGTQRMSSPLRGVPTLTGTLATRQFSRSMTNAETRLMVNKLVNLPKSELESIKSRIATGENKLAPILDKVEELRAAVEGVKNNRQVLFDEAKLHADAQAKGLDTISTLNDGIKEIYETTPEVAQAAKSLNPVQLGLVGKILSYPTRALRLGATGVNLPFAATNVVKDAASAFINSRHPFESSIANPKVFLKALSAAFHHGGKDYGELVREGAGGTSFDISRNAAKETVGKIRADRNLGTKVLYTARHPGELLRAVEDTIGRSEEFSRAKEYFGNKEAALKSGKSTSDASAYGADAARNNTVNFARAGEYGRVLNSVLPYFNAGIQGSRTLLRNLRDHPVQTGAKIVLTASMPVAVTTAWNLSDPKRKAAYDDVQEYEKEGNIIIVPPNPVKDPKTGRWNVIKIPVSQEIANLNNVVRNGIEAMHADKSFDFGAMAGNLFGTITSLNAQSPRQAIGQVVPQAIKPAIETLTNQNLFTGNPIVPDKMKNLDPKDQYGTNTSDFAKSVGAIANWSPYVVDNAIKTAFGGAGQTLIGAKPLDESVANRFTSAQGQTEYVPIDKAIQDNLNKLKATQGYKDMSSADKAKALTRLQNDVIAANKQSIDAKNGTGQYAQDYTGKQTKLSTRQAGLLDGTTDVSSYLTTQTASNDKSPADKYKADQAKYTTDKASGKLSPVQDIKAQSTLKKESITSQYSKDVQTFYSLSKAQQDAYFNTDKAAATKLYDQAKAMDAQLLSSGVIKSSKFAPAKAKQSTGRSAKSSGSQKSKLSYTKTVKYKPLALRNILKRPTGKTIKRKVIKA